MNLILLPIALLISIALLIISSRQNARLKKELKAVTESNSLTQERYDLLTENLAASIIIRGPANEIIFCSPYTEVLSGYATQEIYRLDQDFFLFIAHEDDRKNIERAFQIAACGEAFQCRFRFYHKTGILMWAETRTVPILNNVGEVVATLSITLDVTGSMLYQKQVEEKNKDLQDFTYMVSHDLKGPIYTIKGMHGVLTEELSSTSKSGDVKEALDHVITATGRLESLIAGVLEYSKVSTQELSSEKIALNSVLKEAAKDLEPLLKDRGATLKIADDLPEVLSNKTALYQIFTNLIINSVKYSSPERPPEIFIETRGSHSKLCTLVVRDNGLGIATEKLPSIFRPFQRVNTSVEGTGIGLASVKKLLEKTGGQISVESELNKGSNFYLTLRRA